MINNVSNASSIPTNSVASSGDVAVDDTFIAMLTEKFSNDDVPDYHQTSVESGHSLSTSTLLELMGGEMKDGVLTIDFASTLKQDLQSISYMIDDALEEAGISKDPSFEINYSSSGELYIDQNHPNKEAIEKILNDIPNIRDTYARMSSNASIFAAFERHQEFSKAYEIDPQSAVQKYSHLFNSESCDVFSIFVSEDGYKPSFKSYGEDVDWDEFVNSANNELKAL